ncbi:MAG: hypothetical protein WDN06_02210 [Asticcacaulis sp.]
MTSTNTTMEAYEDAPRPKATGFVVLTLLGADRRRGRDLQGPRAL